MAQRAESLNAWRSLRLASVNPLAVEKARRDQTALTSLKQGVVAAYLPLAEAHGTLIFVHGCKIE
jgi:hypothetical protein